MTATRRFYGFPRPGTHRLPAPAYLDRLSLQAVGLGQPAPHPAEASTPSPIGVITEVLTGDAGLISPVVNGRLVSLSIRERLAYGRSQHQAGFHEERRPDPVEDPW
jgi:hypothetical protein